MVGRTPPYPDVIGYVALLIQGDIEINTDQQLFAFDVEVFNVFQG